MDPDHILLARHDDGHNIDHSKPLGCAPITASDTTHKVGAVGIEDGALVCVHEVYGEHVLLDIANGDYGEADASDITWAKDQSTARRVFNQQWFAATGRAYQ